MKAKIDNYVFDKTAKTIVFTDYQNIRLDSILMVTNVTYQNTMIYLFNDSTKGGTVSGNTLTLTYDTSSMSNTDKLQIFYDDPDVVTYTDLAAVFKQLIAAVANPPTTDKSSNTIRTTPQSIPTVASVTTVGTVTNITNLPTLANVTTVATVSSLTNVDGYQGKLIPMGINISAWFNSVRTLIT